MKNIGKELRYQRIVYNLTQREVAKVLGVKPTTIGRWEGGYHTPSIYDLSRLADFYDISLDELVGREYYGRM